MWRHLLVGVAASILRRLRRLLPLLLIALAACTAGGDDDDIGTASPTPTNPCPRLPPPAVRPRFVVVSHPYGAGGAQTNDWAVHALSASGVLSTARLATFTMGRATDGRIAFTPDGEVGLVA